MKSVIDYKIGFGPPGNPGRPKLRRGQLSTLVVELRDEPPAAPQRSGMGSHQLVEMHAVHTGNTSALGEGGSVGILSFQGHDTVALDAQELIDQAEHPVDGIEGEAAAGGHDMEVVILDGGLQVKPIDEVGAGADVLVHLVIAEDLEVDEADDRVQLGTEIPQVCDRGALQRCGDTHDRTTPGDPLCSVDKATTTLGVAVQHHFCRSRYLVVDEVGQLLASCIKTTGGRGEIHRVDGAVLVTVDGLERLVQGIRPGDAAVGIQVHTVPIAVEDDRGTFLALLEQDDQNIPAVKGKLIFFVIVFGDKHDVNTLLIMK